MKRISKEQWAQARRMDYARWSDGRPYLLYMDEDGATVWGEVEIISNVSREGSDK